MPAQHAYARRSQRVNPSFYTPSFIHERNPVSYTHLPRPASSVFPDGSLADRVGWVVLHPDLRGEVDHRIGRTSHSPWVAIYRHAAEQVPAYIHNRHQQYLDANAGWGVLSQIQEKSRDALETAHHHALAIADVAIGHLAIPEVASILRDLLPRRDQHERTDRGIQRDTTDLTPAQDKGWGAPGWKKPHHTGNNSDYGDNDNNDGDDSDKENIPPANSQVLPYDVSSTASSMPSLVTDISSTRAPLSDLLPTPPTTWSESGFRDSTRIWPATDAENEAAHALLQLRYPDDIIVVERRPDTPIPPIIRDTRRAVPTIHPLETARRRREERERLAEAILEEGPNDIEEAIKFEQWCNEGHDPRRYPTPPWRLCEHQ